MKAYLIALEITPVEIGKTYDGLPLHCTLVHWFRTSKIKYIIADVQKLLESQPLAQLVVEDQDQFTGMTSTGPIPVKVNKVRKTPAIKKLHDAVVDILNDYDTEFLMPQYLHERYEPHITHQEDDSVKQGDNLRVRALFFAEADDAAYGKPRKIIYISNFRAKELKT